MVTMSEMYKNRKKVLIRGAGDLATGVGVALYRAGFRVIMTEIAVPLTVRREVAMSRAVYEGRIEVEGIEGILVENYQEARRVLAADKIAVIVDPEAEIRREFRPDVLVDAILAKRIRNQPGRCTICDRSRTGVYSGKRCPCCHRDNAWINTCGYHL